MSTAAESMNAAARQMQQRVAKNRAAVTVKLADGQSPLIGQNDPFNKANPLNESLYCDQAIQERQREAN